MAEKALVIRHCLCRKNHDFESTYKAACTCIVEFGGGEGNGRAEEASRKERLGLVN